MKRTFYSTYAMDGKRYELIASMLEQGYVMKYKWMPQIMGEKMTIIWEKEV